MQQSMTVKDFSKCCRCCLVTAQALKPLFGTCLNEMLTKLTNLQVALNDRYPQQICSSCVLKLSMAHTFYLTVLKSQKTLDDILKATRDNKHQFTEIDDHAPDIESHPMNTLDEVSYDQQVTSVQDGYIENNVHNTLSTPLNPEIDSETPSDIEDKEEYQCPQCELTSKDQDQLEVHLQTHIGAKRLPKRDGASCVNLCHYCGKDFRWRTSLFKHIRQHKNRVQQCTHCQKQFTDPSSLKVHLITHSLDNPKPFHCEFCDLSFTQKSSLRKHAMRHLTPIGRPKIQCGQCEKSFIYNSSMKRHLESAHSPAECTICHKLFSGKKFLDQHMRSHKTDEMNKLKIQTSTDNVMAGNQLESFNIQEVSVEYLCLICSKRFQSRKGLEVHICSAVTMTLSSENTAND